jgi:hypothetical protein
MKDCTVIIPIHELTTQTTTLLKGAINSVLNQIDIEVPELMLVVKSDTKLIKEINSLIGELNVKCTIVENTGKSDYASQINYGVSNVKTKWFSILAFDDMYAPNWFKIASKEIEINPTIDIYGCLTQEVDLDGNFISFTNEAIWANGFSEKQGYLTNDVLLDFSTFILDGAIINKDKFIDCGGLKTNIVLSFIYEFLLRATANGLVIYFIPKIGYSRLNGRDDSLIKKYLDNLTPTEIRFWYGVAKQEFYYKNEREIDLNFTENDEE